MSQSKNKNILADIISGKSNLRIKADVSEFNCVLFKMEVSNKKRRKEVNKNKILDLLLPVSGCIGYEIFSMNIMNITQARK